MWIILALCHVSKGRVPIRSVCIPVCLIVFQGVCSLITLIVADHTCLTWLWCRCCRPVLPFLWASIRLWLRPGCHSISSEWIQVSAKVSWGKSWRCPLSWSMCLSWRWRCWRASWPQAFPRWGWQLCLDSWCSIRFSLFWLYCAHELPVRDIPFLLLWYLVLVNKLYGVGGALYSAANSIC